MCKIIPGKMSNTEKLQSGNLSITNSAVVSSTKKSTAYVSIPTTKSLTARKSDEKKSEIFSLNIYKSPTAMVLILKNLPTSLTIRSPTAKV